MPPHRHAVASRHDSFDVRHRREVIDQRAEIMYRQPLDSRPIKRLHEAAALLLSRLISF